ncbi:MAG TPA: GNAT family N-acetyltransferase [Solirubrobacteraceae bacterium]|jgi:GNAT superfamily N-acetyltransferase|nr:GNAT family N-acetyltransferase [Solirubrobacteraceae bacterium]
MRLVELDRLSEPYWEELVAGEHEPFGGIGENLVWRDKTRNIGVREDDGRLVAAAGTVLAEVRVGQEPPFQVAGLGGLIVTRSARGRGLARLLCQRLLELAGELEVQRAMLFCMPKLMPLYGEFGFRPIDAPVWADQPGGRIEVPLEAMWKALSGDASWPAGRVELLGEPF